MSNSAKTTKRIVLDSSVIIKWLSSQDENHLEQADRILKDTQKGKVELFTSELSKYEVANALLKGKSLPLTQARASLATLYQIPLTFISETVELAKETYKIASELGITYYDATFLSLAKRLKATLITDNPKHQAQAKGVKVIALKDYL